MDDFPFGLQLPASHALIAKSLPEAQAIHRFGVNVVLAKRRVDVHRAAALHEICARRLFQHEARIELGCSDIERHVHGAFASDIARILGTEIAATLYWFFVLARPAAALLRMSSFEAPARTSFASDASSLRVVVTYCGLGVQWMPAEENGTADLDRRGAEASAIEGNRSHPEPPHYRVVPPWWIAFIKGHAYPGNRGNGLVWRASSARPGIERCMRLTLEACE